VSLSVEDGEVVTLIGPNGAGKTTLLRAISGIVRPRQGRITWAGRDITRASMASIVRLGISQAPEGRQLFFPMTVEDNLVLGAYTRFRGRERALIPGRLERVFAIFPRLRERRRQTAGTLSGGEQQMLTIGRALMSGPRLLLLDEPSMGLSPIMLQEIYRAIVVLQEAGTTILLVEQNARLALQFAQRGYVIENGRLVLQGHSKELLENAEVKKAYLGG
jgi:branched-chain amino acid transport system ATP-binding protein